MAYYDLREWISALDKAGELKRIKAEADPILEIAEITDRVSKWGPRGEHGPGGPALLFENVKGYPGSEGADQPVRLRTPHADGARRRLARRDRRPHQVLHGREVAARAARQNQDAAHAGRDGQVLSQGSVDRPVQGSHQARQLLAARFSRFCNAGRRTAAASSRCRRSSPKIRRPASATSARIACRSTTSARTGMHWQRQKQGAEHYREQMRRAAAAGEAQPVTAAST